MTTLYRPVRIETAEQADAMPNWTVAIREGSWPRVLLRDHTGQHWADRHSMDLVVDMVGWTALVPVEAEEERHAIAACEMGVPGSERIIHELRLVTPWEEA